MLPSTLTYYSRRTSLLRRDATSDYHARPPCWQHDMAQCTSRYVKSFFQSPMQYLLKFMPPSRSRPWRPSTASRRPSRKVAVRRRVLRRSRLFPGGFALRMGSGRERGWRTRGCVRGLLGQEASSVRSIRSSVRPLGLWLLACSIALVSHWTSSRSWTMAVTLSVVSTADIEVVPLYCSPAPRSPILVVARYGF
jgi:hypothetical protein